MDLNNPYQMEELEGFLRLHTSNLIKSAGSEVDVRFVICGGVNPSGGSCSLTGKKSYTIKIHTQGVVVEKGGIPKKVDGQFVPYNRTLREIVAIAFHEVGHILFSFKGSDPATMMQPRKAANVFNILEDQFIESNLLLQESARQGYCAALAISRQEWNEQIPEPDAMSVYMGDPHAIDGAFFLYVMCGERNLVITDEIDALIAKFMTDPMCKSYASARYRVAAEIYELLHADDNPARQEKPGKKGEENSEPQSGSGKKAPSESGTGESGEGGESSQSEKGEQEQGEGSSKSGRSKKKDDPADEGGQDDSKPGNSSKTGEEEENSGKGESCGESGGTDGESDPDKGEEPGEGDEKDKSSGSGDETEGEEEEPQEEGEGDSGDGDNDANEGDDDSDSDGEGQDGEDEDGEDEGSENDPADEGDGDDAPSWEEIEEAFERAGEEIADEAEKMGVACDAIPETSFHEHNVEVKKDAFSVPQPLYRDYAQAEIWGRSIAKKLAPLFEHTDDPGLIRGYRAGQKLDAKTAIKGRPDCFYRKKDPREKPDINVAIMVDASGSMDAASGTGVKNPDGSDETRIDVAIKSAYTLYFACQSLGVPCGIYLESNAIICPAAHMGNMAGVKETRKRLDKMSAYAGNADGGRIRWGADLLLGELGKIKSIDQPFVKVPTGKNTKKVLINISDGVPTDTVNSRLFEHSDAIGQLVEAVAYTKKKGVVLVALPAFKISANSGLSQSLKKLFGSNYIEKDISELGPALAKFLKREIVRSAK